MNRCTQVLFLANLGAKWENDSRSEGRLDLQVPLCSEVPDSGSLGCPAGISERCRLLRINEAQDLELRELRLVWLVFFFNCHTQ